MSAAFKDFRSAVKIVTSAEGDALADIRTRIKKTGFLSCPPPEWDVQGVYRIALGPTNAPEVQVLTDNNKWLPSPLRPTSTKVKARDKHQKFGILDAPSMLARDLEAQTDPCVVIFLDVDDFKALNTRLTERVVDRTILPDLQRVVDASVRCHGFAYAEGGDEMIVLLRNASELMGVAFAETLRQTVEAKLFQSDGRSFRLTVSLGVASSSRAALAELPDRANEAKAIAKKSGKNIVSLWQAKGCQPVKPRMEVAQPAVEPWKGAFFR